MSDTLEGIRYWTRRWLRRWKLYEPAYCRECGGLSFTEAYLDGRWKKWVCDDCGYVHGVTFGGQWRATPPPADRELRTGSGRRD